VLQRPAHRVGGLGEAMHHVVRADLGQAGGRAGIDRGALAELAEQRRFLVSEAEQAPRR